MVVNYGRDREVEIGINLEVSTLRQDEMSYYYSLKYHYTVLLYVHPSRFFKGNTQFPSPEAFVSLTRTATFPVAQPTSMILSAR